MTVNDHERMAALLTHAGYAPTGVLGAGMEGTVFAIGGGAVAKVWRRRGADEVALLKTFYDAVAQAGLTIATPRVRAIKELDGTVVTIEDLLQGTPMGSGFGPWPLTEHAVHAITEALVRLAEVEPRPGMDALPPLEGETPLDARAKAFPQSLADLVERRVDAFREPMTAWVADVDAVAVATVGRLRDLDVPRHTLVHGDLLPPNVLLAEDGRTPAAVLDFGFLSTVGDPAFDAAVSASIYDMYGEDALETERVLAAAIADRLPYSAETLGLYRAAYALATSNVYDVHGHDGHFEWCMRMVGRADVRESIDL